MDARIKKYFMNLDINFLQNKFGKNIIIKENLSQYSWFNLGGPADIFFRPKNKDMLIEFLKENKEKNYNLHVLGAGSNTLFRDAGVGGVVIKLGSKFSDIKSINSTVLKLTNCSKICDAFTLAIVHF